MCVCVCVNAKQLSERPTHCGVEAVGHELTLAIGGDERDGAVVLEA